MRKANQIDRQFTFHLGDKRPVKMASLSFSVDRRAPCPRVQCPGRNVTKRRDLSCLLLILLQETLGQTLSKTFTPKKRAGAGVELGGRALVAFPFIHQGFIRSYFIPGCSAAEGNAHSAPCEPTRRGQKVGYMLSLPITKESAIEVAD